MNRRPASEPDAPPEAAPPAAAPGEAEPARMDRPVDAIGMAAQWLVHCSPERTLVARRRGEDIELVKIFEQGSLLDAQQEAETAKNLAHPGVVRYRTAGHDAVTNKPCVTMDYCEGENLERLVAGGGPLPAGRAAALAAQLAWVLADIHAMRHPGAPHGLVHRDVKPANIQATRDADGGVRIVLMDLEHVVARLGSGGGHEAPSTPGFTGGTHGYSPPESYDGTYPHPGFDVFGIGATLYFLLTGCPAFPQRDTAATIALVREATVRLRMLRGQPDALRLLISDCLSGEQVRRPTAADVATQLREFLGRLTESDALLDRALQAIQATEFATAADNLREAAMDPHHDRNRASDLERLREQRSRLLHRISGAPDLTAPALEVDDDLEPVAHHVAASLPRLTTFLARFPHDRVVVDARRQLASIGHELLERVPPRVANLKMSARFDDARRLIEATALAAAAIHRVPGGLNLQTADPGHLPGPLLRNPGLLLERARRNVERTERTHLEIVARLDAAEAQLDLAGASAVIAEVTAIYGGASTVAAPLKDRLMRLEFYMQRIAIPRKVLVQLGDLLDLSELPHELERVRAFSKLCRESVADSKTVRGKGGIRSLLEIMRQLLDDFPMARPTVEAAADALADAMQSITHYAWDRLNEAKEKLDAVPIPIRPVQKLLNRLDAIRMIGAFLDLPDRNRERLQDEIERIRMRLDQARTTRNNIARGAEEAMEHGHLTTALFDMARAVDNFEDDEPGDPGGPEEVGQLSVRLEEAKRRKLELDRAIVENHRLAALCAELLDDETSSIGERLRSLEGRADVLNQLIVTLGPDKGSHYAADLREVTSNLAQEKAAQGERRLDRATDPASRLRIAQETLRDLRQAAEKSVPAGESSRNTDGRIQRLLDHWQFKEREVHDQVSRERQSAVDEQNRRRRARLVRIAGGIILLASVLTTWHVVQAWGRVAPTVQFTPTTFRVEEGPTGITYRGAPAYASLATFVQKLTLMRVDDRSAIRNLELTRKCAQLIQILNPLVEGSVVPEPAWALDFRNSVANLDRALITFEKRIGNDATWRRFFNAIQSFGQSARLVGLSLAVVKHTELAYLDELTRDSDSLKHIALDPADLDHLRKVVGGR